MYSKEIYCRQFHIVDGDNLITSPWEEFEALEDFLGLEHELNHERFIFNETKGFFCMSKGKLLYCTVTEG